MIPSKEGQIINETIKAVDVDIHSLAKMMHDSTHITH